MAGDSIIRFHAIGGPDVLRFEAAVPEAPGPGDVRLRVQAIGLNNSEAQFRRGDYPVAQADLPTRLGRECAGIVEALGADVRGMAVGDAVSTIATFDVRRHGVYGEWAVVPANAIVRSPSCLSRLEAAAVWQAALTAYGPLVEYNDLWPDDFVVVLAASSSVGRMAIQVARHREARVIAVTRSRSKRALLLEAGAEAVVVSEEEPFVERVRALTQNRGARLILDPITGPGAVAAIAALAQGGSLVCYGQLDPTPASIPFVDLMRKGATIRGYTLWEMTLDPVRRERAVAWIYDRLESGVLKPTIDRVFSYRDMVAAHAYLESGRQTGKIVVDVEGGGRT